MENFKRSLSDITVGMDADDADVRLQQHGLKPHWDSHGNLYAEKQTNACVVDNDGVVVQLELDAAKKVRKINFGTYHRRIPI